MVDKHGYAAQRFSMHITAQRVESDAPEKPRLPPLAFLSQLLTSDFRFCLHRTPSTPHFLAAHMASPLAPAAPQPEAPEKPAMNKFRLGEEHNSDASDSDQSDASGRALSPSRKGLTKSGKRKERKQFGAFADELGDLLGSAFQQPAKDSAASSGNTHAVTLLQYSTDSST
jgi:hypothetical protein